MKTLRWWAPLASLLVALAFGFLPYALLTNSTKMPPALRDNPWPLEVVAVSATLVAVFLAVQAFRQKRTRIVATVSAVLATLATGLFLLLVHVVTYDMPAAPKELAVGSVAPDFMLSDAKGGTLSLASMRGRSVLLVFYRGAW